ncbi:MAG TPA: 4Fe-4S dicluster domain-containing protein [Bryobacteraceae bacterium]|nr:4Fe-4S dicluster domain-containing protein [Bryobacteraceae bacterium]
MTISRQTFLRLSGLSLAAVAFRRIARAVTGPKWGMAIDLAKCAGQDNCTQCAAACRQAHNVPQIPDSRHEIHWIWKEPFNRALPNQADEYSTISSAPVMVMCNHCEHPPCVRVCPTQATFQREDGIVAMDYHRCIGCRYCMAACPYGSRSFNWQDPRPYIASPNPDFPTRTKGVVEKCNFCSERISTGRLPACVEACPEKALTFGNLNDPNSAIRQLLGSRRHIRRKPELGTGPKVFYIV